MAENRSPETPMTLVVSRWTKEGIREINRRQVNLIKKGRWLITGDQSFDAKTLSPTNRTREGGYIYRLEKIEEKPK